MVKNGPRNGLLSRVRAAILAYFFGKDYRLNVNMRTRGKHPLVRIVNFMCHNCSYKTKNLTSYQTCPCPTFGRVFNRLPAEALAKEGSFNPRRRLDHIYLIRAHKSSFFDTCLAVSHYMEYRQVHPSSFNHSKLDDSKISLFFPFHVVVSNAFCANRHPGGCCARC